MSGPDALVQPRPLESIFAYLQSRNSVVRRSRAKVRPSTPVSWALAALTYLRAIPAAGRLARGRDPIDMYST